MFLPEIWALTFHFKTYKQQTRTNGTDRIYMGYADLFYSKAIGTAVVFRLKNNKLIDPKI